MKITCLIDNCAVDALRSEHGLSLWIEACGARILFDTGASGAFAENARALGIDVSTADFAVISHGHNDHGGGLAHFLALNAGAKVYIRRNAFEQRYSDRPDTGLRAIGLDSSLLDTGRFVLTDGRCEPWPGVTLFSDVTGDTLRSPANDVLKGPNPEINDDFSHEQDMLIAEGERRVFFDGCAHRGIANIMRRAKELSGGRLDAVIGGMHLAIPGTNDVNAPLVDGTAEYLLASPGTVYYTGHCTGLESYARLRERMGERVQYLHAGDTVVL